MTILRIKFFDDFSFDYAWLLSETETQPQKFLKLDICGNYNFERRLERAFAGDTFSTATFSGTRRIVSV